MASLLGMVFAGFAKEKWNEDEVAHRDKLQRLRQELSDANANINDTNKALETFATTLRREPRLEDYYTPSPETHEYQDVMNGVIGVGAGWIGYKVYKYVSKRK